MKRPVQRWLIGVGALAAVGALGCGQGIASASASLPSNLAATVKDAVPAVPASPVYTPPNHDLYYGDTGAAVRNVQARLNQLHYYAGPVDGVYGQDTAWAVWAFKRAEGLPMNANTNTMITWAFRHDLAHPKAPPVLVPKGGADRVEINLARQILVLYKSNKVHLILDISTGGGYYYCNPPPPKGDGSCGTAVTLDGNFYADYFIPGWDVVPLGVMYNPVFFDPAAGQAMHGGDVVPWYPASHGCVRLQEDVENWFYTELTIGGPHATPVYVRGTAPYYL